MKTVARLLAEKLLKISAIKLQPANPFVWASGWNSPIYTDNRKTLSYPEIRSFIKIELSRLVLESFPDADVIAGVATGAIAQGALVADELNLPYGCEVIGMVALFNYGFPVAEENFADAGVRLVSLSDYNTMLEVALATQYISEDEVDILREWRNDPSTWVPTDPRRL